MSEVDFGRSKKDEPTANLLRVLTKERLFVDALASS